MSQRDSRAAGGGGTYPHCVGVVLLRAAVLVDKGPAVTRADVLNPPPLEYGPGREAGLGFAVTLEPRDGPYVAVVFGDRGRRGDFAAVVWHSKPMLVRAGTPFWVPDGSAARHPDDMDEPLEPRPDDGPDPDPHDEHLPTVGRSAAAVAQQQRARAAAAEGGGWVGSVSEPPDTMPGRREASGPAVAAAKGEGRQGTGKAAALGVAASGGGGAASTGYDHGRGAGVDYGEGGGERWGWGTGDAGWADTGHGGAGRRGVLEGADRDRDKASGGDAGVRRGLVRRIEEQLETAELWQLQAIAKILD